MLDSNKNNTKGLWNVLNRIIRNGFQVFSNPSDFIEKGRALKNMEDVVNGFNSFFVNVGPELAKQINIESTDDGSGCYNYDRNPSSIFLEAVEEKEVFYIVRDFKNKTSLDSDEMDMTTVKKVSDGNSKPITYICNLSFQTGTFPSKLKLN